MPDTKITALAAITTVAPANDLFPIVDVSDNSMAASGTTKNITVNQLLGAGGTATLASATITGDLTVKTNVLKVDTTNNRVGIGTASPAVGATLQCVGTSTVSGGGAASAANGLHTWFDTSTNTGYISSFHSGVDNRDLVYDAKSHVWRLAAGTAMTLNSTGLGVGRTPSYRFQASSGTKATTAAIATVGGITTTDADDFGIFFRIKTDATATNRYAAISSFDNGSGNGPRDLVLQDLGGNVGVGVTPSAWATIKALQVGSSSLHGYGSDEATLSSNTYFNSGYKYIGNGFAQQYQQQNGQHRWFSATSGTAGTAITDFATAKMTLDASGNLLVGTTSAGGNRLNVQTASGDCLILVKSQASNANLAIDYVSNYGNHSIRKSGTAVWDYGVISDSSATPAFKIQNASSVGVQLVSGATAWTTLSDETMKDIIEPISNAVAKVGSLRSVIGKFKTDSEGTRRSFLIAQDVQSVLPEAVDVVGENNELGLRYTEVIPLLVAAIKELSAEVNALKNA
jgi:hypothetical protein